MINNKLVFKNLIYNVAKLSITRQNNSFIGTGFFVMFENNEYLISNKHVLKNLDYIDLELHTSFQDTKQTKKINISKKILNKHIYIDPFHDSDVAVINFNDLLFDLGLDNKFKYFAYNIIENYDNSFFEKLITIGYPEGIEDTYNKVAIFRICYSATSIENRYLNMEGFLIDGNLYPGCSGSPIYIYNDRFDKMPQLVGLICSGIIKKKDLKLTFCHNIQSIIDTLKNIKASK